MQEEEVRLEFKAFISKTFPDLQISEQTLKASQLAVGCLTATQLKIPLPHYIMLLGKTEDFTIDEVSILCNSFSIAPFKIFKDAGFSLIQYEEVAAELSILSKKWEEIVAPVRKSMNQKLDIINTKMRR